MDLDELMEETVSLEVPFSGGKSLQLTYRPNAVTLEDTLATNATPEKLADVLSRLIASWDLVQKGTPVEITPERLFTLSLTVLQRVQEAVLADLQVPLTPASSSSGS